MKPYPFLCGKERIILPSNSIEESLAKRIDHYLTEKYPDKYLGNVLGSRYLFQEEKLELNWFDDFLIHEILEVEDCIQALYKIVLENHLLNYGGIDVHPIINNIAASLFPTNDTPYQQFIRNYIADSLILQPPYQAYLQENFQVRVLINGNNLKLNLMLASSAKKNLPNIIEGDWLILDFDLEHRTNNPEEAYEIPDDWYFVFFKLPLGKILELNMSMMEGDALVQQTKLEIPAFSVFQNNKSELFLSRKDLRFMILNGDNNDQVIKSILVSSLGKN